MESWVSGAWWCSSGINPSGMCPCCSYHTVSYCLCFTVQDKDYSANMQMLWVILLWWNLLFLPEHIIQGLQSVMNWNLTIWYWMSLNYILLISPPVCQYRIPSHFLSNCVLIKQEVFCNIIYVTSIICTQQNHFSLLFYQNLAFVGPSLPFVLRLLNFLRFMRTFFINLNVVCTVLCCSFKTSVALKEESQEEKRKKLQRWREKGK